MTITINKTELTGWRSFIGHILTAIFGVMFIIGVIGMLLFGIIGQPIFLAMIFLSIAWWILSIMGLYCLGKNIKGKGE